MERLDGSCFDWLGWRRGCIKDLLGLSHPVLRNNIPTLNKYALGFCLGDELVCRPKAGWVGVLFRIEEVEFWTHLTGAEFDALRRYRILHP